MFDFDVVLVTREAMLLNASVNEVAVDRMRPFRLHGTRRQVLQATRANLPFIATVKILL